MKRELQIFFTALMYYTRIPCPKWVTHDAEYINKGTRYFPLIGWIVAGISSLVFYAADYLFNDPVAVALSIIAGILVTGAFHEDGFADVCDGFGGGWRKEKILDIMKDSRVGAFGVIGIVSILLLKYTLLAERHWLFWVLVLTAHSFSRFCAVIIVATSKYVRQENDAKAKPLAQSITSSEFVPAMLFGIAPLFIFLDPWIIAALFLPLIGTLYLRWYFNKWIGGYTGDCLGATQQVTEILFYLNMMALWNFT